MNSSTVALLALIDPATFIRESGRILYACILEEFFHPFR